MWGRSGHLKARGVRTSQNLCGQDGVCMRNLEDGNISVLISCLSLPISVRVFGEVSVVWAPETRGHRDPRQQRASKPSLRAIFCHSLSSMRLDPLPALPFSSPRPVWAQTQPSPASVKNDTGSLSTATSHSHPAPSCENPFPDTALTEPGSVSTLAPRALPSFVCWSTYYAWAQLCSQEWPACC